MWLPWKRTDPQAESAARDRDAIGRWGEEQAEKHLRKAGMKVLGRRVRFGPREELDLVARSGDVLVFVEVKTRRSDDFGRPSSSVDRAKRKALSRAAVHYLRKLKFPPVSFRFDVVEVIGSPGDTEPSVRHIEGAFSLDKKYRLPY